MVYLSQRKDLPVTAMASVKFNVWCAIGNSVHVIHSHLLKMEVSGWGYRSLGGATGQWVGLEVSG